MNENFPSKTTAPTSIRVFCQKLPFYTKEDNSSSTTTNATASSARKRKKQTENSTTEDKNEEANQIIINRIIANPKITKTQIAKISYTSFIPQSPRSTDIPPPISPINLAKETFIQKRRERNEVIDEIKSMLQQLRTKPHETIESAHTANEFAKVVNSRGTLTAPSSYRRAQTELYIEKPKSATTRTRTSFEIETARLGTARTANSLLTNHNLDSATSKKRSYDPTAARLYMKEQQKKRRSSTLTKKGMEEALKKEEIKKRLEDLKKQSKAIISKNVKKNMAKADKINRNAKLRDMSPPSQRLPLPPQYSTPTKKSQNIYTGQVPGSGPGSGVRSPASLQTEQQTHKTVYSVGGNVDLLSKRYAQQMCLDLSAINVTPKSTKSVRTEPEELSKPVSESSKQLSERSKLGSEPSKPVSESSKPASEHHKSTSEHNSQRSTVFDITSQRRVGLLRKPETEDHSFRHIKDFSFEKENVALEMLTPQIPNEASRKDASSVHSAHSSKHSKSPRKSKRSKTSKSKPVESPAIKATQVNNNPSLLDSTHAETKHNNNNNTNNKKEACIQTENPKDSNELPYWLRPSSVQVYPYNFIQAVRRKLQAIAFPDPATEIIEMPIPKNEATSTRDLEAKENESGGDFNRNPNNADVAVESIIKPIKETPIHNQTHIQAIESLSLESKPKQTPLNEQLQKSQTISDVNSNLTSISLQVPCSNTVSEVSSIKSESVHSMPLKSLSKSISKISSPHIIENEDATTVSSSIFSSPEKRQQRSTTIESNAHTQRSLSPLSLERIEKLKIKSKHLDKTAETKTSQQNLDFTKFLSDFNHGLSQVIEANEQLKSTLDKSQLILSPRESIKSLKDKEETTTTQADYTNDFEETTQAASKKESTTNSEKSNSRRKLFEVSAPKAMETSTTNQKNIEFQLDLASVTASSINSSELMSYSKTGAGSSMPQSALIDEVTSKGETPLSPHVHEERLATIVQLKENLRRMIKDSKAQREAIDQETNTTKVELTSTTCSPNKRKHKKEKNISSNSNETKSKPLMQPVPTIPTVCSTPQTISTESMVTTSKSEHNGSSIVTLTNTTYTYTDINESLEKSNTTKKSNVKEATKMKSKNVHTTTASNTITEEVQQTHESSSRKNKATNSVRLEQHEHFKRTHINTSRGEYDAESSENSVRKNLTNTHNSLPPPAYNSCRKIESPSSVRTVTTTAASVRTTRSSEIVTLLKGVDLDLSRMSSCDISLSESSLNYSNVGMYEQLIKSEITKSEHLASLLKMREKAILDRTKGQVAWLQVQKERCKSKGLLLHISTIRKKQRAILLKMAKEREEIRRILQSALSTSSNPSTTSSRLRGGESSPQRQSQHQGPIVKNQPPTLLPLTLSTTRTSSVDPRRRRERENERRESLGGRHSSVTPPILRGTHELETSASVEALLRQREEDLRRRRAYVERLIEWHHKLDEEEADVFNLERQLFTYNGYNIYNGMVTGNSTGTAAAAGTTTATGSATSTKAIVPLRIVTTNATAAANANAKTVDASSKRSNEMERRLKEIDKSLRELNNIADSSSSTTNHELTNGQYFSVETNPDTVRTTGSKLNKLWRRLTSQQLEKFEPNRRYKLCKTDLERLYEEAKLAVLNDFSTVEERSLLQDKALSITASDCKEANETSIGSAGDLINAINAESTSLDNDGDSNTIISFPMAPVPSLNLNFSTSQSNEELETAEISKNCIQAAETFSITKRYAQTTGDYSPSIAEKHFQSGTSSPTSTPSTPSEEAAENAAKAKARAELIKRNLQKFLRITGGKGNTVNNKTEPAQQINALERSLSDTEIDAKVATPTNTTYLVTTTVANQVQGISHLKSLSHDTPRSAISTPRSAGTLKSVSSLTTNSSATTVGSFNDANNISTSSASSLEWRSYKNSKQQTEKIDESSETPTRPTVIKTVESSNCNERIGDQNDAQSSIVTITEPQQITTEFDTKSNEIAAKLNEISEAVARLSQTNSLTSLPSLNGGTPNSTNATNQSQKTPEVLREQFSNTNYFNNSINNDFSYSTTFESSLSTSIKVDNIPSTAAAGNTTSVACNRSPIVALQRIQDDFDQSALENRLLDTYELDFENSTADETLLDDVSMPQCLDTTFDTTGTTLNLEDIDAIEPEKPTTIDAELVEQVNTVLASNNISTPTKPQILQNSGAIILTSEISTQQQQQQQTLQQQLMPDIINELEIRRCQQILLENEQLRQYEHVTAVPYVYVREIPNKPPPPYCPPAHGSPMTTIFPSEDRIKDITFRRTHELYCEILKTDHVNEKGEKLPSVLDEKITNIYERIVLDICREYLNEHHEVLNPRGDPTNFHSQLAFFNPPNRLHCIQESIYKDVRRCLGMDKTLPKRTPVYSIYGQRAKRDHIGQIIIQEMYEEDEKWCSFYHEEDEVLDLIIEEMIGNEISDIAKIIFVEEGGILEETNEETTITELNNLTSPREEEQEENEISIIQPAEENAVDATVCLNDSQLPTS